MNQLKTPLSHLTNRMTLSLELRQIEEHAAKILLKRNDEHEWPNADGDATLLLLLVKSLVEDLHELNEKLPEPRDLCLLCGGHTWGRPHLPNGERNENGNFWDFSKRKCHRCDTIRDEPEEAKK